MWLWKVLLITAIETVHAASRDQWLDRSVYQVVTDRFARSDNSTTASCNAGLGDYCGGSFQGIINKLDYIQELGFDAIWISPVQKQESKRTANLLGMSKFTRNECGGLIIEKSQRTMDIGQTTCIPLTPISALQKISERYPQRCMRVTW